MARIRMIKPEFFDDPDLAEVSPLARLFFVGLWTQADKEGRLPDDPKRLKARLLPYEAVDVECLAVELHGRDMIRRYEGSDGKRYIWIRSFSKHQRPHPKEPASVIPPCQNGAGKRNGEPGKETASRVDSPLESNLESNGTRKLEDGAPCPSLSSPKGDPFKDETITERAGRFIERYADLYPKHRKGARYAVRETRDYAAAVKLCATWPDERLDKLAVIFLTTDHEFAEGGSRTIPQFLALASWCDGRLAEYEHKRPA